MLVKSAMSGIRWYYLRLNKKSFALSSLTQGTGLAGSNQKARKYKTKLTTVKLEVFLLCVIWEFELFNWCIWMMNIPLWVPSNMPSKAIRQMKSWIELNVRGQVKSCEMREVENSPQDLHPRGRVWLVDEWNGTLSRPFRSWNSSLGLGRDS